MIKERRWPWVARQVWRDLLFMHWPVPLSNIRPYVPAPFEIETYNGQAWISIVPFRATFNGPRGMPGKIPFSDYLELNVRTYVNYKGESGVFFFSFDANSMIAVTGARKLFSLPYIHASMSAKKDGKSIEFISHRKHNGYPEAILSVRYTPVNERPTTASKGSLTEWLVERYCFWTLIGKKIYKGPILHSPWDLQRVEVDTQMDQLLDFLGTEHFKEKPLTHYCKQKKVKLFPFENRGTTDSTFDVLNFLKTMNR
ncbi:YqjF family protein [Virgibacillus kekensis]|uniref:YqjF family protein n=1 Tax=Virgibacillus kekensis TaxID=202261 RepID=A0ABV9DLR8_9BACI